VHDFYKITNKMITNLHFFIVCISANCDNTQLVKNHSSLTRPKRQIKTDPKTQLDAQIAYLLSVLPFQLDLAEETIEKKLKFLVINKLSWGWSIVIGAIFDFTSDVIINNRTLGNLGGISTWGGYGVSGFYAIGFGFPYILGLEVYNLPCHSSDFLDTLAQYKLSNGLDELFATSLPISSIRAIVGEFDAWVRIKIGCITDYDGSYIEVAEVSFLLDELIAAMNLRIDIEESERAKAEGVLRNDCVHPTTFEEE
jgi:hypothetical protein